MTKCIKIAIISLLAFLSPLAADDAPTQPKARVDLPEKMPAPQTKKKTLTEQKKPKAAPVIKEDTPDDMDQGLPTPEGSPMKVPDNGYSKQFTGTLIAVLVIILLVFIVIWLMRRFSTNRPLHMNHRKHIKVIERRPLSQSTYVYLVQVGDKQFVVAESKFHVTNVATLDWNEQDPER